MSQNFLQSSREACDGREGEETERSDPRSRTERPLPAHAGRIQAKRIHPQNLPHCSRLLSGRGLIQTRAALSAALHYFRPLLGTDICRVPTLYGAEYDPKYEVSVSCPTIHLPARHRNTLALFVSTMSDCGMGADGTGGWRAGSNQFESQSMFNPVSALPVQCSAHPVLQSMFHSQCIAMFHSQCSTLPLCSIFYPSRRTVVACQCNGECHPVMPDVMTESRKLVRRDQAASSQLAGE